MAQQPYRDENSDREPEHTAGYRFLILKGSPLRKKATLWQTVFPMDDEGVSDRCAPLARFFCAVIREKARRIWEWGRSTPWESRKFEGFEGLGAPEKRDETGLNENSQACFCAFRIQRIRILQSKTGTIPERNDTSLKVNFQTLRFVPFESKGFQFCKAKPAQFQKGMIF